MKRLVSCLVAMIFLSVGCTSRQSPPSTNGDTAPIVSQDKAKQPPQPINMPSPVPMSENDQIAQQHAGPTPVFPVNANGQTYGSDLGATSEEPDLIKAYGVDGTLGYVRSTDLNGVMPRTPEEALAEQNSKVGTVRQIPLYAADGKTVIGAFNVYPGETKR